ncbi:hypothetical protein [uncultured Devosia sp.]|uniref:hypothetical protein n=1 Tax=uncultured Devosia sp. TaxID=211434 RepID=UPI0035CB27F2
MSLMKKTWIQRYCETTKIYDLMIANGHLTRDMFELGGIGDQADNALPQRYAQYRTTIIR